MRDRWRPVARLVGMVLMLAMGVVLPACGSTATPAAKRTPTTATSAGPGPSAAARMVCADEARADIHEALATPTINTPKGVWAHGTYSCIYQYKDGQIVLSVHDLPTRDATIAYYSAQARAKGQVGELRTGADAAFRTPGDLVIARKDNHVLTVDVSGLPAQWGIPMAPRWKTAYLVAATIMNCWNAG